MTLTFDPILYALVGGLLWRIYMPAAGHPAETPPDPPKPEVTPEYQPFAPVMAQSHYTPLAAQSGDEDLRVDVLQVQPDGTWHEIGHASGTRIQQELATPGRAVRWPDGTIQHE